MRAQGSFISPSISPSIDWKLAQNLAEQPVLLVIAGLAPTVADLIAFIRTGHASFIALGIASVVVLIGRLTFTVAFVRQRVRAYRPTRWRRGFLIGAWANGAIYGLACYGAIFAADGFTQVLLLTMATALVMGSAVRNGAYPQAAIGAILLTEGPVAVASIAAHEFYFALFTLFVVLYTMAAISVVRYVYSQTVGFLRADEEKAELMARSVAANEQLAAVNAQLAVVNEQLAAMASTDGLTGVPNRRRFDEALDLELRSAQRDAAHLSVLMFDIDAFKRYNDRYGHLAGDECLRRVAQTLAASLRRPRDLIARYGGEEFAVLLPETDLEQGVEVAEALRSAIEALGIEHIRGPFGIVTISIGVAAYRVDGRETALNLLGRADEALYSAKRAGRNGVRALPTVNSSAAAAT